MLLAMGSVLLPACSQPVERIEVTRVVTETVVERGEPIEVTRLVERVIEVTSVPTDMPDQPKDMVVCMSQEPENLFPRPFGRNTMPATHVQHAIFTSDYTQLGYGYQADGLEKLPSLADDDAVVVEVEVEAGDRVVTADNQVKPLESGDLLIDASGEEVTFDGSPVTLSQLVVDFTMKPRVWADGEPVTAADSVYAFEVDSDPDMPWNNYLVERTAAYEATGDLSTRWTGVPGFVDRRYFLNFFRPLPEHVWGDMPPAELLRANSSSRLPLGDGPFRIVDWLPGDRINLVPNEHYYRREEGLPKLDSLTFRFVPDANQLVAQLLSGQCDIGTHDALSVDQAPFLIEAEESGILAPFFQTGTVYEHIDFGIDPVESYAETRYDWFEDSRVRQAMAMCTNRQGMVDSILFGRSDVMHTYVPSEHPLYPGEDVVEYAFDPAAANALLDEAGFEERDAEGFRLDPDGDRFAPLLETTSGLALRRMIAESFQQDMLACGVDVALRFLPPNEWFADGPESSLFGRRFDLALFAWQADVEPACDLYLSDEIPGPPNEVNPRTDLNYGGWEELSNNTGYVNEEFDEACREAIAALPGSGTYSEAHERAQIIFSEDVPVIPLFPRLKIAVARPDVAGFRVDSTQMSEMFNIFELDLVR